MTDNQDFECFSFTWTENIARLAAVLCVVGVLVSRGKKKTRCVVESHVIDPL